MASPRQVVIDASSEPRAVEENFRRLRDLFVGATQWANVGDTDQPAFQNGWVNYGTVYPNAGFMLDPLGVVWMKGVVKSGSDASVIFTLPEPLRPASLNVFPVYVSDGSTQADRWILVAADGTVTPAAGWVAEVHLACSFRAGQ